MLIKSEQSASGGSLKIHTVANIFPLMSADEYADLKADIAANGQRQPIYTWQGAIIDGRNRYKACAELGIEPKLEEWNGAGSLVGFVVSLNLKRRHLTSSQKAAIAVDILPALEAEAKERQIKLAGTRPSKDLPQKIEEGMKGEAAEQAAQLVGTNRQYVSDAKRIKQDDPQLFEQLRNGALSMTQAKREFVRNHAPPPPVLPSGKYRVFYADPPWQYSNGRPERIPKPEDRYVTMPLEDICEMPVRDMAEDDAVLFLWATSPLLPEALTVIHAWGFTYKSSFVWDKVRGTIGYYNDVRHEFLLIATRGACTPDVQKAFDSVASIEKSNRHSEKPAEFRDMIDAMYTHGARIELFARKPAKGWTVYGNELCAEAV